MFHDKSDQIKTKMDETSSTYFSLKGTKFKLDIKNYSTIYIYMKTNFKLK